MRLALTLIALGVLTLPASSQPTSPYSVLIDRQIKALSSQQIADLRAGRGMGLAMAAELNSYPGPMHVLELADKLDLSATQRQAIEHLFAQMKMDAVPLGKRLVAQEATLDRQLSDRTTTPITLDQSVAFIGATQAALRHAHLKYQLATAGVLTSARVADYQRFRGYAASQAPSGHHHKHQPAEFRSA